MLSAVDPLGTLIRRTRGLAFVGAELRSDSELLACANVTQAIGTSQG